MRAALMVVLVAGCSATDNFNTFQVGDGGAGDAGDGGTADLSRVGGAGVDGGDMADATTVADMEHSVDMIVSPDMVSDNAHMCQLTGLAGVGAGDYTISFCLTASSPDTPYATVLYQRSVCDAISADFWDIRLQQDGRLLFEIAQQAVDPKTPIYTPITSSVAVADGKSHDVIVQRHSGTVTISIDGKLADSAPATEILGTLPPIGITSGDPCEHGYGTTTLSGTVTNVCITAP